MVQVRFAGQENARGRLRNRRSWAFLPLPSAPRARSLDLCDDGDDGKRTRRPIVARSRLGHGAGSASARQESNLLVGKSVVPEGLTHKAGSKQSGRRYKWVARVNILLECA